MTPARDVGGDLYDFFLLDGDRLFFLVGDVAGKGLSASLFMAVSKALYKSTTLRAADATIGELMRAANAEISRDNPEMFFVTAFAGILDLDTGELEYCNAGHENPYVLRPARRARAARGRRRPAALRGRRLRLSRRRARDCAPGETALLVTDGVVEAQNRGGRAYGGERLDARARAARAASATTRTSRRRRAVAPTSPRSRRAPSRPTTSRCSRCAGSVRAAG